MIASLSTFFKLGNKPLSNLRDFINKFETEVSNLTLLINNTTETSSTKGLKAFLESDSTQRDLLLAFLLDSHRNVVDNLSTKDLPYSQVKERLLQMAKSNGTSGSDQAALVATEKPQKKKNKKKVKTCNDGESKGRWFKGHDRLTC